MNLEELPSQLMNVMLRGTLLGYSPGRLSRELHRNFTDVKRNDIHRLIITEMGHVAEEATAKAYEASDIEQYEYMATLESHTCSVCGHLDGEIFNLKDREIGVNYPLMHPRCRCTTVPYLKGLPPATERWMRDPETGKGRLIKDMTFDEWKKEYFNTNNKSVKKNLLPNINNSIIPESKLTKYALDPTATRNGGERIKPVCFNHLWGII